MTVAIRDSDGTERLRGDLIASGGATGDVLTQQADGTYAPAVGGGATPDLAAVLTVGNDTGGREIVNAPAADEEAIVTRRATATDDGEATAETYAVAPGGGDASALSSVSSVDGTADVSRSAASTTWQAYADTSASAGGSLAEANTTATMTGDGNAECRNDAGVRGAGEALATLAAHGDTNDVHVATIECRATASGQSITITGLPSSDPGVPGQLYISAGALKISL